MSQCLLWQCLIITFICFVIYPDSRVFSFEIQDLNNIQQLKFKKAQTIGDKLSSNGLSLTDEQMQKFKIWLHGIIPYFIDDFSFDKVLRDKIRLFLEKTSSLTGLQFLELPHPPDNAESENNRWVLFINRRGQLECADCTSANFTNKGVQRVLIGYDCLGDGELAATILALVGVPPQHNAPNRDDYIQISKDNIIPDKKQFFNILSVDDWLFKNIEYDFASAGHYDFYKYTSNGQSTIKPVATIDFPVGETITFSPSDILKIKMLYQYTSQMKKKGMAGHCSMLFKSRNKIEPKEFKDNYASQPQDEHLSRKSENDNDINISPPPKQNNTKDIIMLRADNDTSDGTDGIVKELII